jgi:hypothetical protein
MKTTERTPEIKKRKIIALSVFVAMALSIGIITAAANDSPEAEFPDVPAVSDVNDINDIEETEKDEAIAEADEIINQDCDLDTDTFGWYSIDEEYGEITWSFGRNPDEIQSPLTDEEWEEVLSQFGRSRFNIGDMARENTVMFEVDEKGITRYSNDGGETWIEGLPEGASVFTCDEGSSFSFRAESIIEIEEDGEAV